MSATASNAVSNFYGATSFGAAIAPRSRTLDTYEIRYVEKARAQSRPTPWPDLSIQLNRSEHDIRSCCDPAYGHEPQPSVETTSQEHINGIRVGLSAVDRILRRLHRGPATRPELIAALSNPNYSLSKTLSRLIKDGRVVRIDSDGGRGSRATYALPPLVPQEAA